MMGRQSQAQPKLFYEGFSLEQRVPANHPLRKIRQHIDFDFVDDEVEQLYYLTPEVLAYTKSASEGFEALGLGELEGRIVEVLEEGKNIKWGKLALAMWLFFLFIVVYTIIETVLK